jgi:hypothetical protein
LFVRAYVTTAEPSPKQAKYKIPKKLKSNWSVLSSVLFCF